MMTELERAKENARSFPDNSAPPGTVYIGSEVKMINGRQEVFYYYKNLQPKDEEPEYYYETASGYRFKQYMNELDRKERKSRDQ